MCALVMRGQSRCALCGAILETGQPLFATSGVFLPKSDPLWKYCDAALHGDCYASWGERPRFARACFRMWVDGEPGNLHWGRAHLDDALLVTVNPNPPVEEVHLHLAESGTRHFVKLKDWAAWLADEARAFEGLHAVERSALKPLMPLLRVRFPSADSLVEAVDWEPKERLIAEAKVRQEKFAQQREQERKDLQAFIAVNNRTVWQFHLDLKQGKRPCPGCGCPGTDFLLKDGGTARKSFLVCPGCGRSFGPEDFPPA